MSINTQNLVNNSYIWKKGSAYLLKDKKTNQIITRLYESGGKSQQEMIQEGYTPYQEYEGRMLYYW